MNPNRKSKIARGSFLCSMLGMGIFLLILAASCGKPQPFVERVTQTPYLGLPNGLDQMMFLDVNRLRDRDFVQDFLQNSSTPAAGGESLLADRARWGIDPIADIDSLCLGIRGKIAIYTQRHVGVLPDNPLGNAIFIARGRFSDPAAKLAKLHDYLAEQYLIAPPPFAESTMPDIGCKIYQLDAPGQYNEKITFSLNFGFPNDNLMVFSFSKDLFRDSLRVIYGKTEGISGNKDWMNMLRQPNMGSMFWGAGKLNSATVKVLTEAFPILPLINTQQYYFDFDFSDRFSSEISLTCRALKEVTTKVEDLRKVQQQSQQRMAILSVFMPETAKLPGRVTILPQGQSLKVLLSLNEQDTSALKLEWQHLAEQARSGKLPGALNSAQPAAKP